MWFRGDHIVAPDRVRDLFERSPNGHFILNPGSDYGKEFTPGEVERLLASHFDPGPQTITIEKPEQVLLAHPKEMPVDLIEALGRELQTVKSVQGAWLMSNKFNGLHEENDPLMGNRLPARCDYFSMPQAEGPTARLEGLPQFVTVAGGAYFFLPGIRALKFLVADAAT